MKIVVIKDATIAGSPWKKGTLLEAPRKHAEKAIADGVAQDGAAVQKAEKAAAAEAAKGPAKSTEK